MFFILEFFVYLIYFLYKMYLYLDREYFLSNNGSKLKKYLTASNLKEENINSIKNEFILKKSNFLKVRFFYGINPEKSNEILAKIIIK